MVLLKNYNWYEFKWHSTMWRILHINTVRVNLVKKRYLVYVASKTQNQHFIFNEEKISINVDFRIWNNHSKNSTFYHFLVYYVYLSSTWVTWSWKIFYFIFFCKIIFIIKLSQRLSLLSMKSGQIEKLRKKIG